MKENNSQLKINLGPLLLVSVLLVAFIFAGSLWNKERTKQKLAKMVISSERIYLTRKDQILKVLGQDDSASESALMREINAPEKGIYQISLLIKKDGSYRLVETYGSRRELSSTELDKILGLLSNDKSVATDKDVFAKQEWVEEKVYVFTPIKNKTDDLVGYFVVGVSRKQDL